jgi:hypothetical protein
MVARWLVRLLQWVHAWSARWLERLAPRPVRPAAARPWARPAVPPRHWVDLVRTRAPRLLEPDADEFSFAVDRPPPPAAFAFRSAPPPSHARIQPVDPAASPADPGADTEWTVSLRRRWPPLTGASDGSPVPANRPLVDVRSPAARAIAPAGIETPSPRPGSGAAGTHVRSSPVDRAWPPAAVDDLHRRVRSSNERSETAVEPANPAMFGETEIAWPSLDESGALPARSRTIPPEPGRDDLLEWPALRPPVERRVEPRLTIARHRRKVDAEQRGSRWSE